MEKRKMDHHHHVLILTYPVHGHINPALQLAKRLARMGVKVTFTSNVFAINCITKASVSATPKDLNFASYSDGFDDDGFRFNPKSTAAEREEYTQRIEREGSKTVRNVINSSAENGCPVSCLVYTLGLPWASAVAREFHIPPALLWIQPATVLEIYYYYFHGYEDDVKSVDLSDSTTWKIQFPGLPLLKSKDLPSFVLPSNDPTIILTLSLFKAQIKMLDDEEKPCNVLVNTFDELEPEALKAIQNYNMITIGPLAPSDTNSIGVDLFKKSKDYKEWMDSKDAGSLIYVSFGSILTLPKKQMEEIAGGLLKTERPFLWVIRAKEDGVEEEKLSCMVELEQKGMIVPWCSQLEVLNHPSLGCFVTHCGWNSTLESIVSGVPVVAFPHWNDQGTNAKLIEDAWRTGVRVTPNEVGTIERDEIVRCIEMVMDDGDKGSELRSNVKKWKELAMEAMRDGGSSDKNLNSFLEEVGKKLT